MPPTIPSRRRSAVTVTVAAFALAVLALAGSARAQQADPDAETEAAGESRRFFDSVSVTATLSPTTVDETPGTVSVIGAGTIEQRLIENLADLVKFEPGVYIESDVTRLGLNGFNIRGIGGNRVLTQVDGVETSEQFDFGPFSIHQYAVDLDALESAEIVRSSSSSLYGSDALGGVVSLFTKDPADYLAGQPFHVAAKALFDSRSNQASGNTVLAGGNGRVQASFFGSYTAGDQVRNQGDVETQDSTRTAPNLQNRRNGQGLGKVTVRLSDGNILRGSVEITDSNVETRAFSSSGLVLGTQVADVFADDTSQRQRYSVDQAYAGRPGWGEWSWSVYSQNNSTDQIVTETRTSGSGLVANRTGSLNYEQDVIGGTARGQRLLAAGNTGVLFSFGGSYKHDTFDMLRDRADVNAVTGAVIPQTLPFPDKYFPKSDVTETGAYLQAELQLGRVTVVPGVRYDNFSMDADANDPVFVANGSPTAADFDADAVSSRVGVAAAVTDVLTLHAQYSGGFRAPPYSAINTGFTNAAGGYTTLPNADLLAETSDNFEVGMRASAARGSFGVTVFSNRYDDFIDLTQRGFNPQTFLLEFQNQNVTEVAINGVELQAQAFLSDALVLNGSFAVISGNDTSGDTDVPLASIAPNQGAIGLTYAPVAAAWGTDLSVRFAQGKGADEVPDGQFTPDAYGVLDVTGWVDLTDDVTLRLGVLNLANATYYEWWNVRGRPANDPAIDRYSSPGTSGVVSLAYGW